MTVLENPKPALNWPDQIDNQLQRARDIKEAIDNGTTGIATTDLGTAITNAQIAQTAVSTHAPGTTTTRNGKFGIMKHECELLMDLVYEETEGLSYEDAKALIEANGFSIKGTRPVTNKDDFEVRNGDVSGTIELIAKAADEQRQAHEWYYSTDKGDNWIYMTTTLQAETTLTGMKRGDIIYFRHRTILKNGPTDWQYDDVVVL